MFLRETQVVQRKRVLRLACVFGFLNVERRAFWNMAMHTRIRLNCLFSLLFLVCMLISRNHDSQRRVRHPKTFKWVEWSQTRYPHGVCWRHTCYLDIDRDGEEERVSGQKSLLLNLAFFPSPHVRITSMLVP